MSCIRFDTCRLRSLGRTSHRARIPSSSCMNPVRRWCIVPARKTHTQCGIHQDHSPRNLRRSLRSFHRSQCGTMQTDTLAEPRTADTLLYPTTLSCTCLRHTPRSFPLRCRRIRCGFRPGDRRSKSRRLPVNCLRTLHFAPGQAGSRSLRKRRLLLFECIFLRRSLCTRTGQRRLLLANTCPQRSPCRQMRLSWNSSAA